MININYIYNRSKKSVARAVPEMCFASMERDVRRLFSMGERPLFFFYIDENRSRILILDDEEFPDIGRLALAQLSPFKIYFNLREKLIQEASDSEFLQRIFVRECLRNQAQGRFAKRRLIADLQSIRDSLMRAAFKPNLIKKILKGVSTEVQTQAVEDIFEEEKGLELERQDTRPTEWDGGEVAPSFSSIRDPTTAHSVLSAGDLAVFNDTPTRKLPKAPPAEQRDLSGDSKEVPGREIRETCSKCRSDVRLQMRFECERCPKLLLCEECNVGAGHKHPTKPVFIVNDSRQKMTALSRMFRRLVQSRAEFFFSLFKSKIAKNLPHR